MSKKKTKAKIATKKKAVTVDNACPACQSEMQMARVMRYSDGPSGMLWACSNNSCMALVSKHGLQVGSLLDKSA